MNAQPVTLVTGAMSWIAVGRNPICLGPMYLRH